MSGRMSWPERAGVGRGRQGKGRAVRVERDHIDATMDALCERYGDNEAVSELIGARWGLQTSHATISRKRNGSLAWGVLDAIALEDALWTYPITRLLWRRTQAVMACPDVVSAARSVAKEAGEAVAALTGAALSASAEERARAAVEIDEAIEALRQARAALEHGDAGGEATIPFRGVVR